MKFPKRITLALCAAILPLSMIACQTEGDDTVTTANDTTVSAETEAPASNDPLNYSDPDWAKDSWLVDIDPDWPQIYIDPATPETAEASMDDYFSYIFDDNVTDIILCLFEQNSLVPTASDAITWMYEKSTRTEENGVPVDYSKFSPFYKLYTETDTDLYEMAYQKVREAGIRPWLSFRMNDVHYGSDETAYLRSDFFYEAKENGYMLGNKYGYYATALDFSEERVRGVMLDYVKEMILRYDVFGVQLDFIREIFCFDYLSDTDYAQYMTQFIRDVHAAVEEAETKFGHDIKLMVRFGRSIEHNKIFGFDAEAWIKEGLVDALVPSPRWDCTDSAIPVDEWKALAGGNVAIFAGMETRLTNTTSVTGDYAKGYSAGFFAKGADGVYFDNFYQLGSNGPQVWGLTRADLPQGTRRYAVTRQDIIPEGADGYEPLPLDLRKEGTSITVCMGEIRPDETVSLLVELRRKRVEDAEKNGMQSLPDVTINGAAASSVRQADTTDSFFEGVAVSEDIQQKVSYLAVYTFEGIEAADDLVIEFAVDHNELGYIDYLELLVSP